MRVFVAGGTGQLGRAAIPNLLGAGHEVRATARGEAGTATVRGFGAEPLEVDLFDVDDLRRAVAGCDAVLRLTTKIPPLSRMRSSKSWEANNRLRIEGARMLADAALAEGVGRFVSESVTFVYADGGEDWIDEDHPVEPAGIGILEAPLQAETEVRRVTDAGGAGVVLRFGSFYSATSEQTRQAAGLARRRLLPVIGAGDNFYASVAVGDAGAAVAAALDAPPGTYNVADDEPLRYRDYIQAYADAVGGPKPLRVPLSVGRAILGRAAGRYLLRSARVSNRRFRAATSWRPVHPSIRDGLRAIAAEL